MSRYDIVALAIRNAQRMVIRGKIRIVQEQINQAHESKNALKTIKAEISNLLDIWTNRLGAFNACTMALVVVEGKFEGETAEKISIRLPEPISEMENTKSSAQTVQNEIDIQITKLGAYIAELEEEKSALYAQLAAI